MAPSAGTTKTFPTARHDIRLCGLTGLIFAILTTALILFLEGFVTSSWAVSGSTHQGLWHTCERKDEANAAGEWFKAVQVFSCLSLAAIVFTFLLITFYLTTRDCKNFNILTLVAFCFITATFMLVTVGVFGVHGLGQDKKASWSYWVVVVSAILCVLAAILSIVQVRRSNVRMCFGTPQQ